MRLQIGVMLMLASSLVYAQDGDSNYWRVSIDGSIVWDISNEQRLPHGDNIEMSGSKVSGIIYYEVNKRKQLQIKRDVIFPQLRTYDQSNGVSWQKYRAYRRLTYATEVEPNINDNEETLVFDKVDSIKINGKLVIYHTPVNNVELTRTLFPSMSNRLFVEKWTLTNTGSEVKQLRFGNTIVSTEIPGYKGVYHNRAYSDANENATIAPGTSYSFGIYFSAVIGNETTDGYDIALAEQERDNFLNFMHDNLVLKTNNPVLDKLFHFSKIRAAESIFDSKMGIVHSPGGGNYYAGIWANDQAEYSGPFFPFLGYDNGIKAAENAYRMFLKNIPAGDNPIPYSFEIEGDILASSKDRGDAAMIAYGASLYLLRTRNKALCKEIWPLIEWSLNYCHSRLNDKGVVRSQTDEMEGRISTGDANLATSSLYYGGLTNAFYLAKELGYNILSKTYSLRRNALEKNIEAHFGYTINGLQTYRYFEGNERLRHWICLPLAVGIKTRAEATAQALLDKLWTENGILVELNPAIKNNTFWDRATLYALKGTFKAGYVEKSLTRLSKFSNNRLLGSHVPYVVEAYPENNMKHLSAESALYCRIFIEGMLGWEQEGFSIFSIAPNLNKEFPVLKLNNIHLGDAVLSIEAVWTKGKVHTKIYVRDKKIIDKVHQPGDKLRVHIK